MNSSIYLISQQTKAIMSKNSCYYRSHILDEQGEMYSMHRPEHIIDNSCIINGASLIGRKACAKNILKINSKVPIPVIPVKGVYMIPTASVKSKDCVWVSYYQIKFYEQRDDRTFIAFNDGTGIYVKISESTFDLQYKRTSQIIAILNRDTFFGGGHAS